MLVEPRTKDNEVPAEICVGSSRSVLVEIKAEEKFEKNREWEQRTGLTDRIVLILDFFPNFFPLSCLSAVSGAH